MGFPAVTGIACFEKWFGCVEANICSPYPGHHHLSECLDNQIRESCTTSAFTKQQVKDLIKSGARDWTEGTSLDFEFLEDSHPDRDRANIRIAFRDEMSWSVIGTTSVPFGKPTMNLAFTSSMTERQMMRKILHEFGHALGFQHEHSSPNFPLILVPEVIMSSVKKVLLDSHSVREFVDENFLTKLPKGGTTKASPFDKHSVMLYPIYRGWNREERHLPASQTLSSMDREWAQRLYPPNTVLNSSMPEAMNSIHDSDTGSSLSSQRQIVPTPQYDRSLDGDVHYERSECQMRQCKACSQVNHDAEQRTERCRGMLARILGRISQTYRSRRVHET